MNKNILFDTLTYAKMLETGNVAHSSAHAKALAYALDQNIYSKFEVDSMIDAALKRFDDRTAQIRRQMREDMLRERLENERRFNQLHMDIKAIQADIKIEFKEFQNNLESHIMKRLYTTLGIALTFITLLSTVLHFFH